MPVHKSEVESLPVTPCNSGERQEATKGEQHLLGRAPSWQVKDPPYRRSGDRVQATEGVSLSWWCGAGGLVVVRVVIGCDQAFDDNTIRGQRVE